MRCEALPGGRVRVYNVSERVGLEVRYSNGETAPLPPSADAVMGSASDLHSTSELVTIGQAEALAGLHRWLHEPGADGDGELVAASEQFHNECESECPRLERELAQGGARHGRRFGGQSSTLERIRLALGVCEGLEPELSDPFHCAVRRVRLLLSGFDDEPGTAPAAEELAAPRSDELLQLAAMPDLMPPRPPPMDPLPVAFTDAIVKMPIPSGPDAELGGHFMLWALRGATMAWHARQCHPAEVFWIGRTAAPTDEPDRSAWLAGYRLVVPEEGRTEPPLVPFVVTQAHREYYMHRLAYRAPEQLTAFDREVKAACEAELDGIVADAGDAGADALAALRAVQTAVTPEGST